MSDDSRLVDSSSSSARAGSYVVVARRYRPQGFEELVGQQHVSRALSNAISTQRVGHAYLFTGARGVGKTSTARILAKALNCVEGPTSTPCNRCDICQSISTGEDVDVLEIDGASNRGIDEIRQLRQNVNVRPSRSRHKIYIIDEVHMLTREAFNALLKTLEEPPEHVKFIFCTTEASKIPITILSRCQRFDFAGILPTSIAERLQQIVAAEGVQADSDALELLARRANGSMRDSQSLLEQLLAFAPERITVADVHAMLGSAGEERLAALVGHLVGRRPAEALAEVDRAVQEGVDLGQLLEQLLGYLRDAMAAAVGCGTETMLYVSPASLPQVRASGKELGLDAILAAMQILDQTLSRLRFSTQGRILTELALVRICQLEELEEIPALIAELQSGVPAGARPAAAARPVGAVSAPAPSTEVKKKVEPVGEAVPPPDLRPIAARVELTAENAAQVWLEALGRLSGLAVEQAKQFQCVAISAPNRLEIHLKPAYTLAKTLCERPDQLAKIEQALAEVTRSTVRVAFTVAEEPAAAAVPVAPVRTVSPHQRLLEAAQHPLVQRAGELFGARAVRVDEPAGEGG
jgi:DNA polymerase-3 subunit gamma/tau